MPLTVSQLMEKMPDAFLPEKAMGVNAVIHFKFTGTDAGDWNAKIADGKVAVAQGEPIEKATMTLTDALSADTLIRSWLLYNSHRQDK